MNLCVFSDGFFRKKQRSVAKREIKNLKKLRPHSPGLLEN